MPAGRHLVWVLLPLLLSAFAFTACGGDGEGPGQLMIVVTGSKGLEFEGKWGERAVGVHSDMGVQEAVPEFPPRRLVYDVQGTIIFLRFQKRQEEGMLRVKLQEEVDDATRVILRLETSEAFGVLIFGSE